MPWLWRPMELGGSRGYDAAYSTAKTNFVYVFQFATGCVRGLMLVLMKPRCHPLSALSSIRAASFVKVLRRP